MKYRVHLTTVAECSVTVEAEDEEAAIEAAYQEAPSQVCAQCSGWGKSWGLGINEAWDLQEPVVEAS